MEEVQNKIPEVATGVEARFAEFFSHRKTVVPQGKHGLGLSLKRL